MMQTESSASMETCCSLSASTSSSYHSEKSVVGLPKRLANTIVFKWTHSKLRWKRAMQKLYHRKYKVQNAEELVQSSEGSVLQKSILYDCLSNIGPISFSKLPKTIGLEDLPDKVLMNIMQHVDPRPLAFVNRRFNRLLIDNIDAFDRVSLKREVVYRFDHVRRETRIFVLKEGRGIRTPEREASSLEDVFARSPVRLSCKITFESGVTVAEEAIDILKLYGQGLLSVTGLTFAGGAMSTESRLCGADLTEFTTETFMGFVRLLAPDLRQVSLFTSNHFEYDLKIFELVNEIESLGILYSRRPIFVITPSNIRSIAKSWMNLPKPHDATVYARLADDCETVDFEDFCSNGAVVVTALESGVITTVVCSLYSTGPSLTFELFG
ncbi:hypothetical protein QR680_009903 [Steinernema hermaphroditum]|uniref:F-box domain-containing protein n=1 Tax=Steinernema hermaphroditum TaxID=289476 RepID=A0AA39INA9_9BILA|nr:hypothetical protein QR680_009903 [Steinernema hermaphroditum]